MTQGQPSGSVGCAIVIATAALSAVNGCRSDADAPEAPPCANVGDPQLSMCGGSDGLVLRVYGEVQAAREIFGSSVRVENGLPSFAVDGQCQYFVSGGWIDGEGQTRDRGWRRGAITDDIRRELECEVAVEDLTSIYGCAGRGPEDADALVVANTGSSVRCRGAGEKLLALFAGMRQRARRLWAEGQPLDGDLHITIRDSLRGNPGRVYAWPKGLELSDYLVSDSEIAESPDGLSKLVPAADAGPLRTMREQYLRDVESNPVFYAAAGIPVTDGTGSGMLYMRDALPYENDSGLWPLPGD